MRSYSVIDSFPQGDINWYNKDYGTDFTIGSSVDKAYTTILSGKKPKQKVIVAVLDGGVDVEHRDLRGKIWVNDREIPGNGKDDDNNGYIDDINGWNFLGNSKGQNIREEVLEQVRIVSELDSQMVIYANIDQVPAPLKKKYLLYITCKKEVSQARAEFSAQLGKLDTLETELAYCERVIARATGKKNNTPEEICALQTEDQTVLKAKQFMCSRFEMGLSYNGIKNYKAYLQKQLNENYNLEFKPRKIVGDNPKDINDRNYGNADVKGPRADHGTFVAGIIAANRDNNYGVDGIAESVEIMAVRTTPDGDEDDKDVALGIRYAVDNGARVINMSFGKDYSLRKQFVDSAIVYAQSKNVLLIHAAGNSGEDLDEVERYPTPRVNDTLTVKTFITVGAHSRTADRDFPGAFSNYGKKNVDLFAPGVDIVSLTPDNKFARGNGTSFSAPVVSGVAALIWSYYPQLTAQQVKDIIIRSAIVEKDLSVNLPGTEGKKKKVKFAKLSNTGGIVNAVEALKLAEEMSKAQMPGMPAN